MDAIAAKYGPAVLYIHVYTHMYRNVYRNEMSTEMCLDMRTHMPSIWMSVLLSLVQEILGTTHIPSGIIILMDIRVAISTDMCMSHAYRRLEGMHP